MLTVLSEKIWTILLEILDRLLGITFRISCSIEWLFENLRKNFTKFESYPDFTFTLVLVVVWNKRDLYSTLFFSSSLNWLIWWTGSRVIGHNVLAFRLPCFKVAFTCTFYIVIPQLFATLAILGWVSANFDYLLSIYLPWQRHFITTGGFVFLLSCR